MDRMVEKTLICHPIAVNSQKQRKKGLKSKNLLGVSKSENECIFLRYQEGFWYIRFCPIISQNQEKGGIYTEKGVVTQ